MSLLLRSLAYGMLGSMADAEDALQEAQLRLHQTDPKPDSEEAFLYRVVSNLCVDKLRKNKVQRKYYKGPWLPEPVASSDIDLVEQAQELSMGFLVLLESLAPTERVVYVLREAFDFSFAEIASVLDMSVANARQHAYRGRVRIKNIQYPTQMSTHEQKNYLNNWLRMLLREILKGWWRSFQKTQWRTQMVVGWSVQPFNRFTATVESLKSQCF